MVDKSIVVRIVGDSGQFVGEITRAGVAVQTMGNQVAAGATRASAAVSTLGKRAATVGKITTLGIAAGLALSAKAAIDFESSFAGVRKTVDASEEGFELLATQIRKLATEIPIGVDQLNRIAEIGGQLGVDVSGLPEFTKTIAELGVTTNLSTEQAALGFAKIDNILGLGQKQFEQMGSVVVDLGNKFATTEDEILTFALRIAPVAASVGITVDEVFALATAFSSVGIPAERGGTAIQRTIIAIEEAAKNGGDELITFAKIAGTTVDAFRELVDQDPAKAFETVVIGLQRVNAEGGNIFELLDDVGLGAARTVNSLLAMSNASGVLTSALQTSERALKSNTALTEEAEKRFGTTASKIELAKNQMRDLAITVGQQVIPIIGDIADGMADLIFGLQNATGATKLFIGILGGLISGATIGRGVYKLFAKVIGVDLVAAMGVATFAASAMKLVIGGLIAVIGYLAIRALVNYGAAQRDTQIRVDELTEALKQQREGFEDAARASIENRLIDEGQLDLLNRLGIGVETFARAILGEENALHRVNSVLEKGLKVRNEFLAASEEGTFVEASDIGKAYSDAIADGSLQDYIELEALLKQRTLDVSAAKKQEREEFIALSRSRAFDASTGYEYARSMLAAAESTNMMSDSLGRFIVPSTLTEEQLEGVTDALDAYQQAMDDAFEETESRLFGQIDLWNKMGRAVTFNVKKILANLQAQVTTQRDFLTTLGQFDISDKVREIFDSYTLEEQQGFVNLAKKTPENAQALIDGYEAIFGPGGELEKNILLAFVQRLPSLIEANGGDLFDALNGVAQQIVEDTGQSPAQAWLGVIQETIENAPAELKPAVAQALRAAFEQGGFTGKMFGIGADGLQGFIDGLYSKYPELARAIFGIRDTVVAVVKNGFVIQSPSKLMKGFGALVGEGFAQGIDESVKTLFPNMPHTFLRTGLSMQAPSQASTVTNNSTSVPTTVIIQDSRHNDLRSDISSGLISGGVTRQVETLVR